MAGTRSGASSIRDVAQAAGVSVATASRVLAGVNHPVSAATREKVEEAARQLGFVPNALARSLSRAKSDTIGVVVPSLRNPYYASMVEGIDAAARQHGLSMLLSLTNGDEDQRETAISGLLARRVDGVIICAGADDRLMGRSPAQMAVPAMLIGQQPNPGFELIATDNRKAGFDAAAYLWRLGHRRFAYLTSNETWHDFHDRGLGISQFLDSMAAPHSLEIFDGLANEEDAYRHVRSLCANGLAATALIASTDRHALGALAALSDAGRDVPGDISVIGFDDYVSSQYLRPALTTMRMPSAEMGKAAIHQLAAILSGAGRPNTPSFNATLVERSSAGPPKA